MNTHLFVTIRHGPCSSVVEHFLIHMKDPGSIPGRIICGDSGTIASRWTFAGRPDTCHSLSKPPIDRLPACFTKYLQLKLKLCTYMYLSKRSFKKVRTNRSSSYAKRIHNLRRSCALTFWVSSLRDSQLKTFIKSL